MDLAELLNKTRIFEDHEKTRDANISYYKALKQVDESPPTAIAFFFRKWYPEGYAILMEEKENLGKLYDALTESKPLFDKLKDLELQTADFNEVRIEIERIYLKLTKVPGAGPAGIAKIMHLLNPKLFVMWTSKIREAYECGIGSKEYVNFLIKNQEEVKAVDWIDPIKTLAKAVDERNYVTFDLGVE